MARRFPLAWLASLAMVGIAPPSAASLEFVGSAVPFAPGVASTGFSEVRLTISPDGATALWFSRDRPGGPGGYDIWMSRRTDRGWSAAHPVTFNSSDRDFDPAFSADGRFVYFASDRPGGLGGDDLYRVAVTSGGFGPAEHLEGVNGPADEWAPMLSRDGSRLIFSSDRSGGSGGHDLYASRREGERFGPAAPLPGDVNTAADEFDATYLADGTSIVFARAPDLRSNRVDLFFAAAGDEAYDAGSRLPMSVNSPEGDTYGPMLDWSRLDRLALSGRRRKAGSMDLYRIVYRLDRRASDAARPASATASGDSE
ncbi:PD40 domain-containing protein [Sphingosinicella sp. CPCC 101087]|uniref:TolB family protein n=1 Tax=Sphingosinicella sp. CPCC 101087 TaxID=2497754 RepID=UPI00101DBA02|nr:PD40 domain-containing protein [Sphingosinicella sp. CPCC 101087]